MTSVPKPRPEDEIAAETRMGTVRLTVSDLGRSRAFYERTLGLHAGDHVDGLSLRLGAGEGRPLVELREDRSAPRLDRQAPGLFHLAVQLPSRADLAHALARLAETRWPLDGASDHLVSEALYLSDPDGNGIEIYRDRPREDWPHGETGLQMATLPLDLRNIASELSEESCPQSRVPAGAAIGHVHLQVAELAEIEAFYAGVLGFDVTVRGYPGALFVSAGGYHHHLGLNTWRSAGSAPPARGAIGLDSYEILLPTADELARVQSRLTAAGVRVVADTPHGAVVVRDPAGNAVVLALA